MAVRPILRMGHPLLRRVAHAVSEPRDPAVTTLVGDMLDSMHAAGGVGLAAPQIGVSLRVVVFGLERSERYPQAPAVPFTVLVNPVVEVLDATPEAGWEGCLSVPGLRGLVARPRAVRYAGFDPAGNHILREVDGFHARVVQHECDHLDGVLYPQRLVDVTAFGFEEELAAPLSGDR
jgi:peptide deformylase